MGFSSYNCKHCNRSLLSHWVTTPTNDWMQFVIAFLKDTSEVEPQFLRPGNAVVGVYDGYSRLHPFWPDGDCDDDAIYLPYEENERPACWHFACWEAAGSPLEPTTPSTLAEDQGYFFNKATYDLPDPRFATHTRHPRTRNKE